MKFFQKLSRPVDNSPLIVFRIIFGLLICLEAWGAILTGWVHKAFIHPDYTFPFIDFSWLTPLPGNGMYYYYGLLGLLGIAVMVGFYYRAAMSGYAILWAGVYFMQKTNYNNHYYLLLLLCFLMILLPAHQYASIDSKRKPSVKSNTCPQWCLWLFAVQITIVYFYAAIAKINPDWLAAKPIAIWFSAKSHYFLVGDLLQKPMVHYVVAYGGLAFDLLIMPLLIWSKTRKYAFMLSIFFHLFNSFIFHVGIFPYLGMAWALFFFEPEKIRSIFFKNKPSLLQNKINTNREVRLKDRIIITGLGIYLLVQLILPIRHHFIKSNVFWTEEGHRLSWRMMLRSKAGRVRFTVVNNKDNSRSVVNIYDYLTPKQARAAATKPDIAWQFIQLLKKDLKQKGLEDFSIYAEGEVSLNNRPFAPLFKEDYDLSKAKWNRFKTQEWLTDFAGW